MVLIDYFDDGNLSEYSSLTDTANFYIQSTITHNTSSNGLRIDPAGQTGYDRCMAINGTDPLNYFPAEGDTWEFHFQYDDVANNRQHYLHWCAQEDSEVPANGYHIRFDASSLSIRAYTGGNVDINNDIATGLSANVWYRVEIDHQYDSGTSETVFTTTIENDDTSSVIAGPAEHRTTARYQTGHFGYALRSLVASTYLDSIQTVTTGETTLTGPTAPSTAEPVTGELAPGPVLIISPVATTQATADSGSLSPGLRPR